LTGSPDFDPRFGFPVLPAYSKSHSMLPGFNLWIALTSFPKAVTRLHFPVLPAGIICLRCLLSYSGSPRRGHFVPTSCGEFRISLSGSPFHFTRFQIPAGSCESTFHFHLIPVPGCPQWFCVLFHPILVFSFPFYKVPDRLPLVSNSESPWGSPFFVTWPFSTQSHGFPFLISSALSSSHGGSKWAPSNTET